MTIWIGIGTVLCAGMALAFIWSCYAPGSARRKLILKTLASALFVALGILCVQLPGSRPSGFVGWMLLGLCLGMAGDVALELQEMFPGKGDRLFVLGLSLFLLGHVAYIAAFSRLAPLGWLQWTVSLAVLALGIILLRLLRVDSGALWIPVTLYLLVISLMLGFAVGAALGVSGRLRVMLLVAAAAFYVSDAVLAYIRFGPRKVRALTAVNLGTYYLAQILLALCVGFTI